MKIVISGGTGFIGSALVKALHERGDEVTILTRDARQATRHFPFFVQVQEWRPPQVGAWATALNGADAVVNLAGQPIAGTDPMKAVTQRWTPRRKAEILSSRVDATTALVEALRSANPRPHVLINQSAIGYYGSQGDAVLTESSPVGKDFVAHVVQQWEAATKPVEELGVRLVLLRTGIVLGKCGGALPPLVLPFRIFMGGTMGAPGQWVSWIHLDDEIGLILYALDHAEVQGVVNATAPNPVTMEELSQQIGRALGRPSWVPRMDIPLRLALGEQAEALLSSERVLPTRAQELGYPFRWTDSAEALRDLTG